MIKFHGIYEGSELVGIGLSKENWRRLINGDPIKFNLKQDMGLPHDITIFIIAGHSEDAIVRDLVAATSATVLHTQPEAQHLSQLRKQQRNN